MRIARYSLAALAVACFICPALPVWFSGVALVILTTLSDVSR